MNKYRKLDKMREYIDENLSDYISDSALERLYEIATESDNYSSSREMREEGDLEDRVRELERLVSSLRYDLTEVDERLG